MKSSISKKRPETSALLNADGLLLNRRLPFLLVQAATVAVFLGRAWQHLYWDAPYRTLLWDEAWMKGPVETLLGMPWREYVTSPQTDSIIQSLVTATGGFYLLCALAALFILRLKKAGRVLLWLGSVSLVFLAALYYKEKFFSVGQFFEYTLQWGSPALLAVLSRRPDVEWNSFLINTIKVGIALTFTCHGLYAIGYYPRPGNFQEMTMNILGLNETGVRHFLNTAGILDFLASALLFFPGRWAMAALAYTVLWGFATAIARVWAYFHWEFWDAILKQWLHESVMRFPHFLIPLALLIYLWQRNR